MKYPSLLLLLIILSYSPACAQKRKVVAIGSSTTEGQKATPLDSSWVARFNYYYKYQMDVLDSIYNLGVGGYTVYRGMPSGYSKTGRPTPDPAKNITKAFSLLKDLTIADNGVVIVNFPTNGYENYTITEVMNCLQIIYDSATRTGNRCYITTTQPRTSGAFGTSAIKKKLANIKDAIIARFGEAHTLNFWDGMYNPADTSILAIYSAGDNTHFNNAGHKELFNRVVAKNIFNLPLPSVDDYRSNVLPSGNWEVAANWQRWNGTKWIKATTTPPSNSELITILGGDVMTINSTLTINGDLTINKRSTVTATSHTINLKGDWTNNGTFTAGTGTVVFNGTAYQSITGTTQFNNITLAATGNIQLNGPTTINGMLTLTSGTFTGSSTYPLVLGSSATFSGGNETSFIMGPLKKSITAGATFIYPIGDSNNQRYRPATISNTGITDDWTVEYVGSNPTESSYPASSINSANIGSVSMFEFWNITPANAANHADITLTYNTGSYTSSDIGDVTSLMVAHWDSFNNRWDIPTGGGTISHTGSNTSGSVKVTNVTSFSPLTIGSLDEDSPLPVVWSSFTADRIDNTIVLNWRTAQEHNCSHFEIERSIDGRLFSNVGLRTAIGNSNTLQQYHFTDSEVSAHITYYYRLRQVDADGLSDYSSVVVAVANGKSNMRWAVWPNPIALQPLNIIALDKTTNNYTAIEVKITAPNGKEIFQHKGTLNELSLIVESFIHELSSGVYGIHLTDGRHSERYRLVRY
jgi:lysophospholipase L1-like esterase